MSTDSALTPGADPAALVRAGRAFRNLTQEGLAEQLGIKPYRLSLIERSLVKNIYASEALAFLRVLEIPVEAWDGLMGSDP